MDLYKRVSETVKREYKVIVGKLYRNIDAVEPDQTQTLMIKDVRIPYAYEGIGSRYQGDIAVLTLNAVIIYRNHIAPVCLNINTLLIIDKQLPRDDTLGLIAGFGQTETNKPSEVLRKIDLPIVEFNKCLEQAPIDYRSFLVFDKFCAGFTNNTKYVCKGDSGGGLTFMDNQTKRYNIYGILSNTRDLGENHCDPYYYSLYTNVMDYVYMIKEQHTDSLDILRYMIEHPEEKDSVSLL